MSRDVFASSPTTNVCRGDKYDNNCCQRSHFMCTFSSVHTRASSAHWQPLSTSWTRFNERAKRWPQKPWMSKIQQIAVCRLKQKRFLGGNDPVPRTFVSWASRLRELDPERSSCGESCFTLMCHVSAHTLVIPTGSHYRVLGLSLYLVGGVTAETLEVETLLKFKEAPNVRFLADMISFRGISFYLFPSASRLRALASGGPFNAHPIAALFAMSGCCPEPTGARGSPLRS